MKTSFSPRAIAAANDRRVISTAALITLFVALAGVSAFGQGGDNPTGVYGAFNVRSTTGGSYDPYTGNATRTIPDITVAGAVGAYPLQWSRTMNSRAGASWRHSYAWSCNATSASTNVPNQYTVFYPDGRVITFTTGGSVGVPYKGPTGIGDRFQAAQGDNVDCFLLLADGGKVKFRQHASFDSENNPPWEFSVDPPTQITDPNSLSTTLTYDSVTGRLTQVTEPAGRWLKIYYRTDTDYVGLIDHVNAGYGAGSGTLTQTVTYTWEPYNVYKVLKNATYSDNIPGSYDDVATYTYTNSNVTGSTAPLLWKCRDTRYPGPMKNISYDYVPGGALGVLLGENHLNADGTSTRVVTLTINTTAKTRTETRAGGTAPTRTFYYGANAGTYYKAYLLLKQTDFLAKATNYTYDAAGFLNSVIDANSNTTSFTRLAATGAITKITHPGDASHIDYAYEDPTTGYYLKSVTDELGRITTYLHGNTTTMTTSEIDYPDGGVEMFLYNGFNQVTSHTMVSNGSGSTGGVETYTYDTGGRGLLTKYTPPTGTNNPTFYGYDVNDHLSTVTDPGGNVTTLYHDQFGRLTIIQYPGTPSTEVDVGFVYNPDGTLQYQTVRQNATTWAQTDYTYDDYKRIKTIVRPLRFNGDTSGRTTKVFYDANGTMDDYTHTNPNPTHTTTPAGVDTVNIYDDNFRLLSTTIGDTTLADSTPAKTSYTYDAVGNLKTVKDPRGQVSGAIWTYNYDVRDRLLNVTDPTTLDRNSLGHTLDYTYDLASNKKSERRANDQLITYDTYDNRNRLTKMTVPQGTTPVAVTSYTWTKAGKLDTTTDPRLKVYNYNYDTLNRPTTTTYPSDGGGVVRTEVRTYDTNGNLATFKNRAGNLQTFTYDTRNRETFNSWNDGGVTPSRTLTYNTASQILTCANASATITNTYFDDGHVSTSKILNNASGFTKTVTYTYDADGRRASVQYPSSKKYNLGYTPRGELRTLYDSLTPTHFEAYYIYDRSGNLLTRNLDQYQTHSSSLFDSQVNRLTQIQHFLNGSSPKYNYGYDKMGNRTSEQRDGVVADGYRYDVNNQMTSFWYDGTTTGPATGDPLSTIAYDASGNRTSKVEDVTSTTYATANNLNQYPTVGGLSATYDLKGNLKTYDGWTYTYDAMNRLTRGVKGSVSADFWYDGFNRIVTWQENGSANVRYNVWDGWDLVAEYKAGNVLETEYLHGAGSDELVSMTRNGQLYYYVQRGNENSSQLVDDTGQLVETCWYWISGGDPFITVAPGKTATGNRFLFTGREYFSSIGLYNYRNRFYSPKWGRFLQPDPIGFSGDPANLYRYVGNNPVNWSDPFGLTPQEGTPGNPARGGLRAGINPVLKKHREGGGVSFGMPGGILIGGGVANPRYGSGRSQGEGGGGNNAGLNNNAGPVLTGLQWLTGLGPRDQNFLGGDPFTEMLRQHSHLQGTRKLVVDAIIQGGALEGTNNYNLGGLQGIPKYLGDYSTVVTGGLTGNLAVTYLGSYSLTYQVTDVNFVNRTAQVQFHVFNPSTIGSATHPPLVGYTSWWGSNIGQPLNGFFSSGPLSRTTQTFDWTETISWFPPN